MSTITITRAERDVILDELWRLAPAVVGDPVLFATREEAEASIRELQFAMAIRDALGWTDDDPREAFDVPLELLPIQALRAAMNDCADGIDYETHYRDAHILEIRPKLPQLAGRTWAEDYATIEEAHAAVDREIARYEAERVTLGGLIARIEAQVVIARATRVRELQAAQALREAL